MAMPLSVCVIRKTIVKTYHLQRRFDFENGSASFRNATLSISAIPSQNSIELPVQVQTTDTGEVLNPKALLNCGATGQFIDRDYVKENRLTTRTLSRPIPVSNVDGTLNEARS